MDNGFTFLGVTAGGDWEEPVFFIIYFDGKGLRGYIPENGNTYNKITKTAFGSEGESDVVLDPIQHKSKILEMFPHVTEEDYQDVVEQYERDKATSTYSVEFSEYLSEFVSGQVDFDDNKLVEDIKNRIEVI